MSFHPFDMTRRRVLSTYHPLTQRILDRANAISAVAPTNLVAFDNYIRSIYDILTTNFDVYLSLQGNGSSNFRRINISNPEGVLADFYGSYTLDNSGFKGNGINAFIDPNFNPSLLTSGQKYSLNDANVGIIVSENTSTTTSNASLVGDKSSANLILLGLNSTTQRMHYLSNLPTSVNFSGTGLKLISRSSNALVNFIDKDQLDARSVVANTALPTGIIFMGRQSFFGVNKISSAFAGKSISLEVSQAIRTAENAYMLALGLPQLA